MKIHVYNRQKALPIAPSSVREVVKEVASHLALPGEEMSIYFVSEKKIGKLHQEFFDDPSPTDCITFPIDRTYSGDLFICPSIAKRYDTKAPYQEILLYVVHGLLHLVGYDDLDSKNRRIMRKMEKKCMDRLNTLNLKISPK